MSEKGLYNNADLIDTLIVDLNRLPKMLIDQQFIQACSVVASMGQRLANLKETVKKETDGLKENIETLKQQNKELIKDGKENGTI